MCRATTPSRSSCGRLAHRSAARWMPLASMRYSPAASGSLATHTHIQDMAAVDPHHDEVYRFFHDQPIKEWDENQLKHIIYHLPTFNRIKTAIDLLKQDPVSNKTHVINSLSELFPKFIWSSASADNNIDIVRSVENDIVDALIQKINPAFVSADVSSISVYDEQVIDPYFNRNELKRDMSIGRQIDPHATCPVYALAHVVYLRTIDRLRVGPLTQCIPDALARFPDYGYLILILAALVRIDNKTFGLPPNDKAVVCETLTKAWNLHMSKTPEKFLEDIQKDILDPKIAHNPITGEKFETPSNPIAQIVTQVGSGNWKFF